MVNLIMMEDEESQTHLEPLERESAEEWRPGTGRCGVRGLDPGGVLPYITYTGMCRP